MFSSLMLFLGLGISQAALSFENEYISFDLPNSWMCSLKKMSWVCSPQSSRETTEAIIVISAKQPGPEDQMRLYLKQLSQPKMLTTMKGRTPTPSKVIHAKSRMLGPQQWVEALHLGSEVYDFYTLYLATKTNQIAVLVSLSADRDFARKYNLTFANVVKSIKLKRLPAYQKISRPTPKTGIPAVDQTVASAIEAAPQPKNLVEMVLSSRLLTAMSFAFLAMLAGIIVYALK